MYLLVELLASAQTFLNFKLLIIVKDNSKSCYMYDNMYDVLFLNVKTHCLNIFDHYLVYKHACV